jgi:hypothetical protein
MMHLSDRSRSCVSVLFFSLLFVLFMVATEHPAHAQSAFNSGSVMGNVTDP